MTNHRRSKPQPPVFSEADKLLLSLMEKFRSHMRIIERDKPDIETALMSSKLNPLQFKYIHYEFLFKVWMTGYAEGVIHEIESRSQTSAPGDSAQAGSNRRADDGAGQ